MDELRKILLVGDEEPLKHFVYDLISEKSRSDLSRLTENSKPVLYLRYTESFYDLVAENVKEKSVDIFSPYVPFGTVIKAPLSFAEWENSECDMILFLFAWPFNTEDKVRMLKGIDNRITDNPDYINTAYKVVLYHDKYQRTAVNDIVGVGQAMNEAPEKIRQKLKVIGADVASEVLEYEIFCGAEKLVSIASGTSRVLSSFMPINSRRFMKWLEKTEYVEDDYDLFCYLEKEELMKTEMTVSITSFSSVKGSNDVMKSYAELYIKRNFKSVFNLFKKIYTDTIKDICFWDLNRDLENHRKKLEKFCIDNLTKDTLNIKCPTTLSEYQAIIRNKNNCDTRFGELVSELVLTGIKKYILDALNEKRKIIAPFFREHSKIQ